MSHEHHHTTQTTLNDVRVHHVCRDGRRHAGHHHDAVRKRARQHARPPQRAAHSPPDQRLQSQGNALHERVRGEVGRRAREHGRLQAAAADQEDQDDGRHPHRALGAQPPPGGAEARRGRGKGDRQQQGDQEPLGVQGLEQGAQEGAGAALDGRWIRGAGGRVDDAVGCGGGGGGFVCERRRRRRLGRRRRRVLVGGGCVCCSSRHRRRCPGGLHHDAAPLVSPLSWIKARDRGAFGGEGGRRRGGRYDEPLPLFLFRFCRPMMGASMGSCEVNSARILVAIGDSGGPASSGGKRAQPPPRKREKRTSLALAAAGHLK